MLTVGRAPGASSALEKRRAVSPCEGPRKNLRLTVPEIEFSVLLNAYRWLKRLLTWNIDFAIKFELTEGLKIHNKIFGKSRVGGGDIAMAWDYSMEQLAKMCNEETANKVLSSWYGETADERRLNMQVLELMSYDWPAIDKPFPKAVYTVITSKMDGRDGIRTFTLTGAKEICQAWGALSPDGIPCDGGFEELNR